MKKFIRKILFLLLLFFVIIQIPKWVLPPFWGNEIYDKKLNHLKESGQKYNTFFIGTSRVNNGIIPKTFDAEFNGNIKTFNLGAPGSSGLENIELAKYLMEHKTLNVKNIFIELPSLELHGDENRVSLRGRYYYDLNMYSFSLKKIFKSSKTFKEKYQLWSEHTRLIIENAFSISIFDDMLKYLFSSQSSGQQFANNKGYRALYINTKKENDLARRKAFLADKTILTKRRKSAERIFNQAKYPKDEFVIKTFEQLIDKAEEQNIRLYFVLYPKAAEAIYEKSRQVSSKKIKAHVINLASPKKYDDFYKKEYSFDRAHLNHKGAKLLTKACAREFKKIK